MIARKISPYMVVPFLMAITPGARADEAAAPSDGLTIGVGGKYAPRYSGSDKQSWQVVPVLQGRKGAFFIDSQKGIGYDLAGDSGLYFEHTLGYDLGRAEKNSGWRDGANTLKGMGNIKATMNTAFAVGWSVTPWLTVEGKATLPLTDARACIIRPPQPSCCSRTRRISLPYSPPRCLATAGTPIRFTESINGRAPVPAIAPIAHPADFTASTTR